MVERLAVRGEGAQLGWCLRVSLAKPSKLEGRSSVSGGLASGTQEKGSINEKADEKAFDDYRGRGCGFVAYCCRVRR